MDGESYSSKYHVGEITIKRLRRQHVVAAKMSVAARIQIHRNAKQSL